MRYLVLVKLRVEKFPEYFIQIAKDFDLAVHPNLTDSICVDEYYCNIEEIHYDISDGTFQLRLNAVDNTPHCNEESEVVQRLKDEAEEMKEYGWWVNDWDYKEKEDI